jgi:hypothetical protein
MKDHDAHDGRIIRDTQRIRLTRRGFLSGSSAALATTGLVTIGTAVVHDASAAIPLQATPETQTTPGTTTLEQGAQPDQRAAQFFNIHEAATVDALVSRLLPGSADDPGAHEAGVVFYIDQSLGGTNLGYTLKTYT